MDKKNRNLKLINNLREFKENWNAYGDKGFSKELCDFASEIIESLEEEDQPKILPIDRESIRIKYEKDNGEYLVFEIYSTGIIEMCKVNTDGEEIYRDVTIEQIKGIVKKFNDTVYYIPYIITVKDKFVPFANKEENYECRMMLPEHTKRKDVYNKMIDTVCDKYIDKMLSRLKALEVEFHGACINPIIEKLYADYNGKVWNLSDKESKITYVLSEVIKLISQCKGYEDVLITREYNSHLGTVIYHNIFYKILLCYNRVYNKDTFFDINNKGRVVDSPYGIENIIKLIRHSILIDIDYINDIKNKSIDDKLSLLDKLGGISITIKKLLKINEKCGD
jgi:hypothetical protein